MDKLKKSLSKIKEHKGSIINVVGLAGLGLLAGYAGYRFGVNDGMDLIEKCWVQLDNALIDKLNITDEQYLSIAQEAFPDLADKIAQIK